MATEFTPFPALIGGVLIGISAVLLMLFLGRIAGATGILSGALLSTEAGDRPWRLAMIAGMLVAATLLGMLGAPAPVIQVAAPLPLLVISGVIVGVGVTLGSGCTSGHGVCGMARLSHRSIAATLTFMLATGLTVYLTRHVFGG